MSRAKWELRRRWDQARDRVGEAIFARTDRSRWCSVLYYAFFNRAFHWELGATTAGLRRYRSRLQSGERCALLRRNIHRLEKGLLMRPRRPVFALDFLEETVVQYELRAGVAQDSEPEREELRWATAVLSSYFSAVQGSDNPTVESCRTRFELTREKLEESSPDDERIPYSRNLDTKIAVDYEGLHELARHRRSNRYFLEREVPRALTEKAVEIATHSPSACNRQPFEFRVFDDPTAAREVASLAPGARGFAANIPAVAVLVGNLDNYFTESDRHLIYIDSSLAAMGFIYGLEVQGLSSCSLNWPDSERLERRMAQKLGLEPYQRAIMLIAFGYPDPTGLVAYSEKKSARELCRYNEFAPDRHESE